MTDRILRRREVEARIGLSRSTIYEGMAEGVFPKPIKIGKRAVGWPESAIVAWLEGRAALASTPTSQIEKPFA
jgi:prophage regulatory protein